MKRYFLNADSMIRARVTPDVAVAARGLMYANSTPQVFHRRKPLLIAIREGISMLPVDEMDAALVRVALAGLPDDLRESGLAEEIEMGLRKNLGKIPDSLQSTRKSL